MQIASYCILKCYPIRCIPDFTWSKGNVFRFDQFEFILPQVGMQCMFNGREVHLRRPCVAYKLCVTNRHRAIQFALPGNAYL